MSQERKEQLAECLRRYSTWGDGYIALIELLEQVEEAFTDILDIESGWTSPQNKRSWTKVREISLENLELVRKEIP